MSRDSVLPAHHSSVTHHRGDTAGKRIRFTFRAVAALLLLTGVAGGAQLAPDGGQPTASEVRAGQAPVSELDELRRFEAAYERADRQRRETEREEAESEEHRVSRAEEVTPSPEPEPEPEPDAGSGSGSDQDGGNPGEPAGPVPDSCSEYSGNRATGCTLLLDHGFGLDQMSCLDNLWERESGWNHTAQNPSSGAYGIPQALPGNKMADAGSDWQTNPATQIRWGLGYIDGRYGTPCGAWQFFQNNNWY